MRAALVLLLVIFSQGAAGQYSGPAVESCLDYAKREQKQNIVFDRDQNLLLERHTRKLGSQPVSSVLTGNGAVVYDGAPSSELGAPS